MVLLCIDIVAVLDASRVYIHTSHGGKKVITRGIEDVCARMNIYRNKPNDLMPRLIPII